MKKGFEGLYFRHQKGDESLCVIFGQASDEGFVQLIAKDWSHIVHYPIAAYQKGKISRVGDSTFSPEGITLAISDAGFEAHGTLRYGALSKIRGDIMGVFRFLPIGCYHSIVSMRHDVSGQLTINGVIYDFNGGFGYIEGDRGHGFPKRYAWLHCNDFANGYALTAACAELRLFGLTFHGCFALLASENGETRLATYHGAKPVQFCDDGLIIKQGARILKAFVPKGQGHMLLAPMAGQMTRQITERALCPLTISFMDGQYETLRLQSENAAFEYVC